MSDKPCRNCRSWKDCNGKDWFSAADIRFCPYQLCWIIKRFLDYDGGKITVERDTWPPEEKETGYVDAPKIQKSTSPHAPFERPMQIVAEVMHRLTRAGMDGRLLVLEVQSERIILSREANAALYYCSGWRRKRMPYSKWKADRNYHVKKR